MVILSVGAATCDSLDDWPRIASRVQQEAISRRPHVRYRHAVWGKIIHRDAGNCETLRRGCLLACQQNIPTTGMVSWAYHPIGFHTINQIGGTVVAD